MLRVIRKKAQLEENVSKNIKIFMSTLKIQQKIPSLCEMDATIERRHKVIEKETPTVSIADVEETTTPSQVTEELKEVTTTEHSRYYRSNY